MDCIVLQNVTKRYGNFEALKYLSFSVPCQGRYALLGPNGAGKSTTMKILAGLLRPDQGRANIGGHPPESKEARKMMGYLPEDPLPYRTLSVRENLEYIASLRGLIDSKERAEKLMDLLDLKEYDRVQAGKLSRGNRQKLALAMAIIHDPSILLLDEPLNYLDIPTQERIISLLNSMNSTFLVSTHIMSIATRLTDHVIIIAHGSVIWEGTIFDLKKLGEENEPIESVVAKMMTNVR
ncbi:multidrug ABC transporter ATP-binding protein [Candidatus Acidianus copahuensis]|uniref:Multidrug ABC transporter ATP-binding protein n=1 Tax=Candidatus Acidianus copahuensis TaxID=1160895 RepID=A0A031LTC6_9CREN|nr:ABC transporter ATP-binding protein [Candidatus Acidianus copahuensis]EZQ11056.1 multidrug ABC transporter ATP-binding protein [Candidatus Acidianus copahuensis]